MRPDWNDIKSLKHIRDTPVLFIASHQSRILSYGEQALKLFSKAYQPKIIWLEDSVLPEQLVSTWPKEFKQQIESFLNIYLHQNLMFELCYDIDIQKLSKREYKITVDITR